MNIVHILSQFEVTGAETFAATLADRQIADGHSVWIISDNFYTPTKATVVAHPIGKRDVKQRIVNVRFLRRFIREHRIDVVHAHSRASSWVSYFATRFGTTPLVSSIHGRQHLHLSSQLFSVYGEKRVAVCRSIYDHLNHDLKYGLETLSLVHNGIDMTKWEFRPHTPPPRKTKIVSFVGRLSGFKGDTLLVIVEKVFPKVLKEYGDVEFHIIGGMNEKSKILPAIAATNAAVGKEFIIAKGFSTDVEKVYRESDLIVGSGRVAMEALACGSPVVAIGESNYVGILEAATEHEAVVTNFGDLDARRPIDVERSTAAIVRALRDPGSIDHAWGRRFIDEQFEITKVSSELSAVYTEAVARKKGIIEVPVLLYNAVADAPEHPLVVRPSEFREQLSSLKKRGLTPVSFRDIAEMLAFRTSLPDRPVVLTFGPAAVNAHNAFPLLKEFGMTGTFFFRTDEKEGEYGPSATLMQARELHSSGMEVGSASHSQPKLNLVTDEQLQHETAGSKRLLEVAINGPVISYSYPHGFMNEKVRTLLKDSGIRFAAMVDDGRKNFWLDLLKIRRIQVFRSASAFAFWRKTTGHYHDRHDVY